jgi:hypothetical protein
LSASQRFSISALLNRQVAKNTKFFVKAFNAKAEKGFLAFGKWLSADG